ncbi:serine/threonine-protein kinase [Actinomadura flavalba]|uniref:serine/threonine-protein kinase n=1 Tax=Actinomadura flavalba TaxID=1120938 RepID=UPI000361B4E9|nr:serine/threonine-protein kinase [Actinomadura flavalba]
MRPLRDDDPPQVGPYRLLARLGSGGMGRVFLGRSPGGRMVAVKLVHPELARDPEFRRRFDAEVRAARAVGGRWTAPVLDADTGTAVPWVATGYVPGPSLHDAVREHGPLPPASALALAAGLAEGLAAVHEAGLVHRDLKPSNVLLTIDRPLVIDFGIVRSAAGTSHTRTGAVIGSPGYMSPEQVRGERLDASSDVFGLGAVLAFAATGRPPFAGTDPDSGAHAMMFRVVTQEPDLGALPPGPLRDLIERCLAKDARARPDVRRVRADADAATPADARDASWLPPALVAALGRHTARLLELENPRAPAPAPAPAPSPMAPPPARRRSARSAWLLGAGAAVVAVTVLTAFAVRLAVRDDDAPPTATGTDAAPEASDGVPAALVGSWEGWTGDGEGQRHHRYTIQRGRLGDVVVQYRQAATRALCEYEGALTADGGSVTFRPAVTYRLPRDTACTDEPRRLSARGDRLALDGAQTLHRVTRDQVDARLRGRWSGTASPGSSPVQRQFTFGTGSVGTEAVDIRITADGADCEATALLISAAEPLVIFSTRITRRIEGDCTTNSTQIFDVTAAASLTWRRYTPRGDLETVPLRRR